MNNMKELAELLFNSAIRVCKRFNVYAVRNGRKGWNMDFQAYNKIFICNDAIKNTMAAEVVIGYEFKVKYPAYRGTFLSCIEELSFRLDGEEIPKEDVYFCLNNKQFLLDELKDCFKEYWFIRDKAVIQIRKAGGIGKGEHKVKAFMKHRIPYTGYFGEYLVLDSDVTKTLIAQ